MRPSRNPLRPAVRAKSTPTDPVTVVDTETERLLRDRLAELRPGERILGEEGGGPAAGSRRAADVGARPHRRHGELRLRHPAYAVSVAVQVDGVSVAGAVANVADRRGVLRGAAATARTFGATVRRCRCGAAGRRTVNGAGGHRLRLRRRSCASARRTCWPAAAAECATCVGSGRRRWTCAWSPRVNSTPTTRTASQRLGLGGRRADRRRGGRAAAVPPATGGRRTGMVVAGAPGIAEAFIDALRRAGAL